MLRVACQYPLHLLPNKVLQNCMELSYGNTALLLDWLQS